MRQNGKMIILGVVGLILAAVGVIDLLTSDVYDIVQGEDHTISYYFYVGVGLIILSIVGLVRSNRKIK